METHPYGSDFIFKEKVSRDLIEKKLTELVALIQSNGLNSLHELRDGSPSNVVLARISEINPDLIIMGTHGRRGFSHLVNGSVAEAVLRRATCPVLTVKNPKFNYGFRQWVPGESP
jgi:nucleotide-binding universal stress UspA family protein